MVKRNQLKDERRPADKRSRILSSFVLRWKALYYHGVSPRKLGRFY